MAFWSFKMSTIVFFIIKYIIYFYFINSQSLVSWSVLWFHFKLSSRILYKVILYFDFIIQYLKTTEVQICYFFFWVMIIVTFFLLCLLISECLIIYIYLWGSYRPKLGIFWCFYYKWTGPTETIYFRLKLEPIHCESNPAKTLATWFQDLMEFRFLMSHHIKNSERDKVIGKKWVYSNSECRPLQRVNLVTLKCGIAIN